ncbi:MAG: hypothetical protein RML12_09025 [Xanthomonadales bacterium]|nr:hypothetical protein [Xanthomonadales bacterium]
MSSRLTPSPDSETLELPEPHRRDQLAALADAELGGLGAQPPRQAQELLGATSRARPAAAPPPAGGG